MLMAEPRGERQGTSDRGLMWPIGASLLAHSVMLAWLLSGGGRTMPTDIPPVEIELVQQTSQERGATPQPQAAPPTAATPTPPVPALPPGDGAQATQSAPPAASQPAATSPAPPSKPAKPAAPAPEINLGTAPTDLAALNATSPDIKPATPDARYRNLPPAYPAAAARTRAEGTVQLIVHVAPSGLPSDVFVAQSSGTGSLDEAARRAAMLWRFRPARQAGRAVGFDYVINIRFALGAQ